MSSLFKVLLRRSCAILCAIPPVATTVSKGWVMEFEVLLPSSSPALLALMGWVCGRSSGWSWAGGAAVRPRRSARRLQYPSTVLYRTVLVPYVAARVDI